ncbi:MAG: bifunctional folylpolyglutamate synthase/dihydrofolate synthase, partial [Microbacterium gubbeenense]
MTGSDIARADAVYEKLIARAGEAWVEPRLERTARILDYLDNPQRTYRVVHVTGTNGKTSTARIIESLIRAHGLRTGLFTSPHLVRFTERILIDGEPIADEKVADAWDEIEPFIALVDAELEAEDQNPLTYFELLTVLAFVACADAPVDVLVLEVGMGGSWDSTNTADGDVAVIAPIDVDHANRLGDTPEQIAEVKAGIIKDGARVVSARQSPEVAAVLRRVAGERGAAIAFAGGEFALEEAKLAVGGQLVRIRGLATSYDEEYLPMYGRHQGENAALAIAAVESLIGGGTQKIADDVRTDGFAGATSPGRLQLVGTEPTILVDGAHNPHGARALVAALGEYFDFDEWGVVLGTMSDKDIPGIIRELAPVTTHLFATEADSERSASADEIADAAEL